MRACGATVFTAELACGEAQVVQRGRLRLISRGPVWHPDGSDRDHRVALRQLARWGGATLVTPETDLRGWGLVPLITPLHHAVWDLSGDPRGRMEQKWRNRLSAGERAGILPKQAARSALAGLVARESAQRRARGYAAYTEEFTMALPRENMRLWEWVCAGEVVAGMAFVVEGATASYHMGWAGPVARKHAVHNVMLWHAALALRREAVRWLDLGLVNDIRAPGLARFKLGTGAQLRRLGHTLLVMPA